MNRILVLYENIMRASLRCMDVELVSIELQLPSTTEKIREDLLEALENEMWMHLPVSDEQMDIWIG